MEQEQKKLKARPTAPRKLYKRATAAALLDTSINMLKALERRKLLTPIRLGRRDVFYNASEVEKLAGGERGS